jgi:mono/diheme cytochrome c family protein
MPRLLKLVAAGIGAALATGGGMLLYLAMPAVIPASAMSARQADLTNGRTIFHVGGCASCHATGDKRDPFSLGGGHALKTSFGTFIAPNISSHPTAGIGSWSEAEFATAMIKGVGKRGEHLYPAFPYTSYQRLKLEDVQDLFAFMKTLPAVDRPNAPHDLAFPFNIRLTLGMWKLLFLDGKAFEPRTSLSPAMNRGAYLVEGAGHCAECHSRRNALGAITAGGRMAGGPNAEGKGFVPNISQHAADGLADWSVTDFEMLLLNGGTPAGAFVADEMADVVKNTAQLSPEDRRAMAEYLKSLPPRAGRRQIAAR